jgi:drug/metabolite transporter (DMT)-like permease
MNGILGAVIGATGFGSANVVIKKALQNVSIPQTLMMSTLSGLAILVIVSLVRGYSFLFSGDVLLMGAGLALFEVVLYLTLYKTFEVSNVTVATAILGCYPLLSTLFTIFVLSQGLSMQTFGFMVLMIVGVTLTSINWAGVLKNGLDKKDLVKGWKWIAMCTVLHAMYFPMLGEFTSTGIWESKLLLVKVFSVVALFLFFVVIKKQSVIPAQKYVPFTSLLGLLEMIGWAGYSWANSSAEGKTAIFITVLNSSALVTAVLAYFFLQEKLSKGQYVGIGLIVASLTGLSLV